jgi:UDP-GlcNAc:undecaprenyl-phosphate GlcNAc-1-phosphate transferase
MPTGLSIWVLAGGALLLAVGLADDVVSLPPGVKLLAQGAAAMLAVWGGLRFSLFDLSEATGTLGTLGVFGFADVALTVLWIVLITNAVNLSDGLDGLAAGIGVFAFSCLACTALRAGDVAAAIVPLALVGALLGFLRYNFNPATIFLGDTGSLVIGYAMAVLPLAGAGAVGMPPLAIFLLVALPFTDTLLAIARRFVSRCLSAWGDGFFLQGIVEGMRNTVRPDRRHIHHRLLDLGFSQRRAVLLLYLAAAATGALAHLVAQSPGWPVDLFAVGLGVTVIALVRTLGFDELRPARSGLFLPLLHRLARHRRLIVATDVGLVVTAYGGVLLLAGRPAGPGAAVAIASALALMAGLQLVIFAVLGVYRTAWWATGISGFGLLVRACAAGAVGGFTALRLLGLPTGATVAIVYFFLFLSVVTLMRFSYALLTHAARSATRAEPTLICGTTQEARHALAGLRRAGAGNLTPVGFVEFRPRWEGRHLEQLPVLGSLDALRTIIREQQATHLVIAEPALRGDALDWVRAVCRQLDVQVHRYVEQFVSYDELREALRGAADVTAAWTVLGEVFDEIGLDACVLSAGGGVGNGAHKHPRKIYSWRRAANGGANVPPPLAAYVRNGWESLAEILPHLNGHGPTVLRHEGERLCRTDSTPRGHDVLAAAVRCGGAMWGILLATAQGGDRVITPAQVARLGRATNALGQQVEEWKSVSSDHAHDIVEPLTPAVIARPT